MSLDTTPEQDSAEVAATTQWLKKLREAREKAASAGKPDPYPPPNVAPPPDPNAKK